MLNQGRGLLQALKETAACAGQQLVLRIPDFKDCYLRPIPTKSGALNSKDVLYLTEWRNRNQKAFLTEFTATTARTERWLTEVVHNDDTRILFMLVGVDEFPIGYMGLGHIKWAEGYGEADAIVRGHPSEKGVMTDGLITLVNWARYQLGINHIGVRVLSDNRALSFYNRVGFVETKRVPLVKHESADQVTWVEDELCGAPERYLVYHSFINPWSQTKG
ncbi:MAG: GNAT family N-acetyltransferase [Porticoccaceae bacterium]